MPRLSNHVPLDGNIVKTIIPKCLGLEFEYALNMSICEYKDKYFAAYRVEKYPYFSIPLIVMAHFDPNTNSTYGDKHVYLENYIYQWEPKFFTLTQSRQHRQEDPRLFVWGDKLMLQFGDGFSVYTCEVNAETFKASDVKIHKAPAPHLTLKNPDGREKNWVPFTNGKDELKFIYSFNPFIVIDSNSTVLVKKNYDLSFFTDKYGTLRGGSASYWHNGYYYTFTHSSFHDNDYIYTIACAKHTETELCAITLHPLMIGESLQFPNKTGSTNMVPCGNSAVVFVAGAIRQEDGWLISYGVRDSLNCTIKITDHELDFCLTDVIGIHN